MEKFAYDVGFLVAYFGPIWLVAAISLFGLHLHYRPTWSRWWHVPLIAILVAVILGSGMNGSNPEPFYLGMIVILGGGLLSYAFCALSLIGRYMRKR